MLVELSERELAILVSALGVVRMEYMGCDDEQDATGWKEYSDLAKKLGAKGEEVW